MRQPETVARLILYHPHPAQERLHACPARFRFAACGRRFGKTLAAVNELAKYSWENAESPSWWVAPTYKQSRRPFALMLDKFRDVIDSYKQSEEMSISWKSGGRSEFVSAEKWDNLRGEGVGFMVLDEAAFISKVAWEQALRPMLSDTMGRALAIGTPNGRGGFFYEGWVRGNDADEPDFQSFQFPTSASPYISDEEIAEVARTLPEDVFAQEYEANFLSDAAGVFRNVRACIGGALEPPSPAGRYVIGADLARKRDFTVLTVIDTVRMCVVAWERFNELSWKMQMERIVSLARRYWAPILMDSTGLGDPIVDGVRSQGIVVEEFSFNNARKQQLVENLAVAIEHERIHFPKIDVLISELESFRYEMTRTRLVRYSAPEGFHDDAAISLALALWQAERGSRAPTLLVWDSEEIISVY